MRTRIARRCPRLSSLRNAVQLPDGERSTISTYPGALNRVDDAVTTLALKQSRHHYLFGSGSKNHNTLLRFSFMVTSGRGFVQAFSTQLITNYLPRPQRCIVLLHSTSTWKEIDQLGLDQNSGLIFAKRGHHSRPRAWLKERSFHLSFNQRVYSL